MVSSAHNVCPKGYFIAILSTIAENEANHHLELEAGFERLGAIEEKFMGPPIPIYEPLESGEKDNIFISKSYDATSHFETTTGEHPMSFWVNWLPLTRFNDRRLARRLPPRDGRGTRGGGTPRGPAACSGVMESCGCCENAMVCGCLDAGLTIFLGHVLLLSLFCFPLSRPPVRSDQTRSRAIYLSLHWRTTKLRVCEILK